MHNARAYPTPIGLCPSLLSIEHGPRPRVPKSWYDMSYSRNYQHGYDSRNLKVAVLVVMHVVTMQGVTVINKGFVFTSPMNRHIT
jgi:hypothetical protein